MAKVAKSALVPTFLEQLEVRHDSFQKVEESGARQIRHEVDRIKQQMLRTVETGMETLTSEGKYLFNSAAVSRAQGVLKDMDDVLARGLDDMDAKLLSLKEGAFQRGARDFATSAKTIPGAPGVALGTSFEQVFPEAAQAALTNSVMGIRPSNMWNGVRAGTNAEMQRTLMSAVLTGESVRDTAQKLAAGLDITQGAAERIARTNLNAMYNDAHKAIINANTDIFAGYRWLAALDDRTSAICIRLHGTFFPTGTNPPGPPAHWNCRSIVQPVFKDPALQAQMMDDTQRVKNFKADGKVKEGLIKTSTSSEKWLRRQPQWVQQEVLGSRLKADLFRAGKAGIEDVVSPAMQVLSDDALVRRMAALRPGDKQLQALAKERGLGRVPSKKAIAAEDRKLARSQWFEQPQAMLDPNTAPAPLPSETAPSKPTKEPPKDKLPKGEKTNEQLQAEWDVLDKERQAAQWPILKEQKAIARVRERMQETQPAFRISRSEGMRQIDESKRAIARHRRTLSKRGTLSELETRRERLWQQMQSQFPEGQLPANLPDEYLPLDLARARITQAEFQALKSELDELLEARTTALGKAPPKPGVRPRGQAPTASWRVGQEEQAYDYQMNRVLQNSSDDMARSRLLMHRAELEMQGWVDIDFVRAFPKEGARAFKEQLKSINRSVQHDAFKEEVVANMRDELKRSRLGSDRIDRIASELRESLDMLNDSVYELPETQRWRSISWSKRQGRAFANKQVNEIVATGTDGSDVWMHEFAHHIEDRNGAVQSWQGWRSWMAWKKGTRYGSTGNKSENGWLGVFYKDYVGRVYSHGSTETASMGQQALFRPGYATKMAKKGPEHWQMLWASHRGWAKWPPS